MVLEGTGRDRCQNHLVERRAAGERLDREARYWNGRGCLSTSDVLANQDWLAKPLRVSLPPLSPFGLEPLLTAQRTGGTSEPKTP